MKEISISITYERDDQMTIIDQIAVIGGRYVPLNIKIMDINFEKDWIPEKTRITFRGVEI